MRKKFRILQTAACAAVCLLFAVGCGKAKRELLWYQDAMRSVVLEKDGYIWRITPEADGYTGEMLAPESVAGVSFFVSSGAAYAVYGDLRIPVRSSVGGMEPILSLLHLKIEDLIRIEADEEAALVYACFRQENAVCTVGMSQDGLPVFFSVESDGETVRYTVQSFSTEDESEK